ncbi:MAG TPA: hypothetical protein VMA54_15470 [Steroidobacteraceae bacterium]|nr:hypothetical protein [Steroidobacteraceae bacterium]
MEAAQQSLARRAGLPLILIAAVIQGWSLYGLHWAIEAHRWPATHTGWLISLYAVAFLVPTTTQLMAEFAGRRSLWVLSALLASVVFYFGWHYGSAIADVEAPGFASNGDSFWSLFPFAFVLFVWWLLALPFVQSRVASGSWRTDYQRLFAFAWRNKITLAEAALFTGLFWLILLLWQSLFEMLGMHFFETLFEKPIFVYPVTAIVFGCALHLIGSIDALVSTVLEQLLNVLKWLATVTGALLVLFTIALLTKVPSLISSGRHTIDAAWLLWLVAVIVLFLNAAYRDGKVERPYPRWISQALRFAVPLTIVIAATALYALTVRSHYFGLTVSRIWGFIVAGAALIYSVGYSIAAFRKGAWLGMASRVNVMVAVALIVVIGAALTPLLSPYRLAAMSQYELIVSGHFAGVGKNQPRYLPLDSPFNYLARSAGKYGREELDRLRALQGSSPNTAQIRDLAARALQPAYPAVKPLFAGDYQAIVAKLPLYPAGHAIDPELSRLLAADWRRYRGGVGTESVAETTAGVFIDLEGSGVDDFVLFSAGGGPVYRNRGGHWQRAGMLYAEGMPVPWPLAVKALSAGGITAVSQTWKDLSVGTHLYRVIPNAASR